MSCYLTVLSSNSRYPATKSFSLGAGGVVVKTAARIPRHFHASTHLVDTIHDLASILERLSTQTDRIVIRGEMIPNIVFNGVTQRLQHDREDSTATFRSRRRGNKWACFDFDKIICPNGISPTIDSTNAMKYLASLLPPEFHNVTFWGQWSSSAGMDDWETLSAHLWFMFDRHVSDGDLRLWANSINAPIDTHLFNPVQPHFTAAPIFNGVADPCKRRNFLCSGDHDTVSIDLTTIREQTNDRRGVSERARTPRANSEGDRTATRIGRPKSGSCNSKVGIRRVESTGTRRRSGAFHGICFEISTESLELMLS